MRKVLTILLTILFSFAFGQDEHLIKVYFLYGSKPAWGYKHTEKRLFGGIHGGHVSIGIDTNVVGFGRKNGFHIFSHRRKLKGAFRTEGISHFRKDTVGKKYTTFQIHLTDTQYLALKNIIHQYLDIKTPYDYAFLGMRCASVSYDMLSHASIFKPRSNLGNIITNFYPKKLRKKMFKLAKKYNYPITKQPGSKSRKWEHD